MKQFLYLFVLCTWFLYACGSEASPASNEARATTEEEVKATPAFDVFFEQFKTDTAFQMAHIAFPLRYQYLDFVGEEMDFVEEQITAADWVHNSFDMDEYSELGEGILSVSGGSGKRFVQVVITGTGVSLEYVFEEVEGMWKLTTFTDGSM